MHGCGQASRLPHLSLSSRLLLPRTSLFPFLPPSIHARCFAIASATLPSFHGVTATSTHRFPTCDVPFYTRTRSGSNPPISDQRFDGNRTGSAWRSTDARHGGSAARIASSLARRARPSVSKPWLEDLRVLVRSAGDVRTPTSKVDPRHVGENTPRMSCTRPSARRNVKRRPTKSSYEESPLRDRHDKQPEVK